MLALQRSVGNRAAARLVQRQPQPGVPLEKADAPVVQPADRHSLELAIAADLPAAFTAFSNATMAHVASIKNAAKAEAETIATVIDVATGFLAPIFANVVNSKLLTKVATAEVQAATKSAMTALITKQDLLKAAFTGATKIANQYMKTESNALFGEESIDAFALALRNTFQRGLGQIANRLGSMPDAELIAVWAAYQPEVADETAYRHVLGGLFTRFQQQVERLGERGGDAYSSSTKKLYTIQLPATRRLALVDDSYVFGAGSSKLFWGWITPDMEPIARAKAAALHLPVDTLQLADLEMITLADILDAPNRPTDERRRMKPIDLIRSLSPTERAKAAADPDAMAVVAQQREYFGWHLSKADRQKAVYLLQGYSDHVLACVDELDSWYASGSVIVHEVEQMDSAERARIAKDPWFMDKLRDRMNEGELANVLYALGVGPKPPPPPPMPQYPYPRHWH